MSDLDNTTAIIAMQHAHRDQAFYLSHGEVLSFLRKVNESAWWRKHRHYDDAKLCLAHLPGGPRWQDKCSERSYAWDTPGGSQVDGCGRTWTISWPEGAPVPGKHAAMVRPPAPSIDPLNVIHQIAHAITPDTRGSHGPEFADCFELTHRRWQSHVGSTLDMAAAMREFDVERQSTADRDRLRRFRKSRHDLITLRQELSQEIP